MSMLKGGNALFADVDQQILSSTKQVLLQNIEFQEAKHTDTEAQKIYSKYKPINASYNLKHVSPSSSSSSKKQTQSQKSVEKDDSLPVPKVVLFPPEKIQMQWKETRRIGPGFSNLGNTCFLNSVLQVLTYTPPLVNYVNSDEHRNKCVSVGFCLLCELRNHVTRVAKHLPQNGAIRPMTIIQKLSYISKNFKFGRQEDAHEFLRYFIEALRKSCLAGKTNLDRLSKETTAINQIFGGFFRSQVICLSCKKESNTYDPLMEINLDIKEANSIISALKRTIRVEKLDGENKYYCDRCRKKMPALKKGNIHKAPKILTVQLKRFDFQRLYGGKVPKHVNFTETLDLSPFMSKNSGNDSPCIYKLYAVLVHSGISCNSGHYYCYVKAPNGIWYEMNDSRVSQVGLSTVLHAQAYLLFYTAVQEQHVKTPSEKGPRGANMPSKVPPSPQQQTPKKPSFVKDIGISIVRKEPKIVPLNKDRQKIQFSFQGLGDKKPEANGEKKQEKKAKLSLKKSLEKVKTLGRSQSLQAICTEYDSNSSDGDSEPRPSSKSPSDKQSVKKEHRVDEKLHDSIETKTPCDDVKPRSDKEITVSEEPRVDREAKVDEKECKVSSEKDSEKNGEFNKDEEKENVPATPTSDPAVKIGDAKLSPPKSAPTEVLHQKRKLKPSPFGSKFGRWLSARNFNQAFTPRALYCRSNSDSATLKTKSAQKQDAAEEADKEKNGVKQKPWVVEEKAVPGVLFGPMTPPPSKLASVRERTSSLTSETGSVANKTGEWDVHDKDLPGTPMPPHVPERQFAGWSVEKNKPTPFRLNSTGHDGWEYDADKEKKFLLKDREGSSSKKRSKTKEKRKYERSQSQGDKGSQSHKKHKKRRNSEVKRESDEESHSAKKRRKHEDEEERNEKRKKKKDKKRKSKLEYDSDDQDVAKADKVKSEGSARKERRRERRHPKREDSDEDAISLDKHKKKERKLRRQSKSRVHPMKDDTSVDSVEKSKKCDAESLEADKISCDTPDATPRRVPLIFLGGISESPSQSKENQLEKEKHADEAEEGKSHKKKKKKSKKSKSGKFKEECDEVESKLDSPVKKRTPKKDVPVKNWDEAPKNMTSWNGSNNTSVLDTLLSKKSRVETWNGDSSSNIDDNVKSDSKRSRDHWDEEYDEGKRKKVKKHHHRASDHKPRNQFQVMQNQRNEEKAHKR